MLDTSPVTAAITKLITAGLGERELLPAGGAAVTTAELSAAPRDATAAAERQASRRH